MGLMDSIKDAVRGEVSNRFAEVGAQHPIASQLLTMFGGGNQTQGLSELMSTFQQKGLAGIVNSWVGTGENLPINADQIEQALGQERVQQIAMKFGVDPQTLKEQLAQVLPTVVDKLTPNGKIENQEAS
jgi:uncharacterized protein YidB (DUF937 family)